MIEPVPEKGECLGSGLLYRRVPNTVGRWDPNCGLPGKFAFAPRRDPETKQRDTGISTYLACLTSVDAVLHDHDANFGVVIIDIADLHRAIVRLRRLMGGVTKTRVTPFGDFTVMFDPSDDPADGPARHAHCWMNPVPTSIQKELVRLTSPARVAKPCGPLRADSGSADP